MSGEEPRVHSYRCVLGKSFQLLFSFEAKEGRAFSNFQSIGFISLRREFADNVLPYIKNVGYNAVQLMALQVHRIWSLGWMLADPRFL
jgi:hypothetical protein